MRAILVSVLCIGLVISGCSDGTDTLETSNDPAYKVYQTKAEREALAKEMTEIIDRSIRMGKKIGLCLDDKFKRFDDGSDVFKLASMFYVMCRKEIRALIPHVSRDSRYKYELPYQTVSIASELVRFRDRQ